MKCSQRSCLFPATEGASGLCLYHKRAFSEFRSSMGCSNPRADEGPGYAELPQRQRVYSVRKTRSKRLLPIEERLRRMTKQPDEQDWAWARAKVKELCEAGVISTD